jgi:hypothetical protein
VIVFIGIGLDGLLKNNWTKAFQWFGRGSSLDGLDFFNGWISGFQGLGSILQRVGLGCYVFRVGLQ